MTILDFFRKRPKAASIAKDRLSVIVARERAATRGGPDYLPQLQQELLAVLTKYETIDLGNVSVKVDKNGEYDVLLPSTSTFNCPFPNQTCPGVYRFLANDPGQPGHPNPGYNPAYFHLGFRHGPARVPRRLIDEFADLVETAGIKGKFSVIPYPFGLGRVDQDVQGIPQQDVR